MSRKIGPELYFQDREEIQNKRTSVNNYTTLEKPGKTEPCETYFFDIIKITICSR